MIGFFRRIRRKFADDNQFFKYSRYAIGEVILVVIGILIALQINNWNENRKMLKEEQSVLIALEREFSSNKAKMYGTLNELEVVTNAIEGIAKHTSVNANEIDEKKLSILFRDAFKPKVRAYFSTGAINELINSGKLGLISNSDLRIRLSNWPALIERKSKQENFVYVNSQLAHDIFMKKQSFRRHLDLINSEDGTWFKLGSGGQPPNDFSFLSNQEFESRLMLYFASLNNLKDNFYVPLSKEIQGIINDIDNEIHEK